MNEYKVVIIRGEWHVSFSDARHGPFRNQEEAVATAKGWARKNEPAVVLVDAEGMAQLVWKWDDPVPPRFL